MRLGFSKLKRKLAKSKIRSLSHDGAIYFFDDHDRIIGKLREDNLISLFVTDDMANVQILNLAFSFKYKCGQDVIIADVAFMSVFNDNMMPVVAKSRQVKFVKDEMLDRFEVATCGTTSLSENTLAVSIPLVALEDILENVIPEIASDMTFFHLTTRTVR